jgi:peptidoglycan/xylan/chitin deacetylase (PgdA/CDA1 family)
VSVRRAAAVLAAGLALAAPVAGAHPAKARLAEAHAATVDAAPTHPPAFHWPHGERAAVSLAYDDAIDSQLDHAVPALDRFGLKASFYLTLSSPSLARRLPEWRALAAHGHELGNHTLFHQCSHAAPGHEWVTPENDLDHIPAAAMAAQVRLGNTMLQAIDGRTERTFTLPCGDRLAAGTPTCRWWRRTSSRSRPAMAAWCRTWPRWICTRSA